ncbi:MAG: hypothetical protein AB1468_00015 [Candidatus Micrarchaeota archaeon]
MLSEKSIILEGNVPIEDEKTEQHVVYSLSIPKIDARGDVKIKYAKIGGYKNYLSSAVLDDLLENLIANEIMKKVASGKEKLHPESELWKLLRE